MSETLSPQNGERDPQEDEGRVKDIDTAKEMAETEKPIRDRMLALVDAGVPSSAVEQAFSQQLDKKANEAADVYQEAREIANRMLISAVQEVNKPMYIELVNRGKILTDDHGVKVKIKAQELMKQQTSSNPQFTIHEATENRDYYIEFNE